MMFFLTAIAAAAIGVFAWYMRQPNYRTLRLSAARFVGNLPLSHRARTNWRWSRPLVRRRFWLRLTILALLAVAITVEAIWAPPQAEKRLAVRMIFDTSYSMTAAAPGQPARFERAIEVGREVLGHVQAQAGDAVVCMTLATVDNSVIEYGNINESRWTPSKLAPRPEGGSIALLRSAAELPDEACPPTHAVVITDRPAPNLASTDHDDRPAREIVWLDIASPVANLAIAAVRGSGAPLTPGTDKIVVSVVAYGLPPPAATLQFLTPNGTLLNTQALDMAEPGPWQASFIPPSRGNYTVVLTEGGGYTGDDRARVRYEATESLAVDWRLRDPPMPTASGWHRPDKGPYDLAVVPISALDDVGLGVPVVAVYDGYRRGSSRIGLFSERNALLEAINFDVLEYYVPTGIAISPDDFRSVLADEIGRTWFAVRSAPRGAIVPRPRLDGDDALRNLSLTVFFNALRWVLAERVADVPFDLLTPDGTPVRNGRDESNTNEQPRSVGTLARLAPTDALPEAAPNWPWSVLAALVLLLVERLIGVHWREVST